jgi:hypothetical protein
VSKPLIWLLIGCGLFCLIFGGFISEGLVIIGLALIGAGLFLALGPNGILRKEQVFDTWAILIENAQGYAENIFQDTEGFISHSQAPCLKIERKDLSAGVIKGIMGNKRQFLVVTDQENFRLKPFQIFINSRDYGISLDVSWHLTYRPSFIQSICSLIPYISIIPTSLSDLDLFDEQDLRVYATNIHHCLLQAVTNLMVNFNQDTSKIDRKSKGFLGIS